jgi:hypothetical protein
MREFYIWTKVKPYYRGPLELDDSITLVRNEVYLTEKQVSLMLNEYAEGSRYNWHFVYGFNDVAHITVNPK